ncbi:VWA domain-containing protein [Acetobacter sp. TBRC 12305]|uniref:VWA domain-containing protein n=1 Tax=Acetobacter garciniae TaxID=2817435 RepID=A0A939HJL5_9PROT|nr:VWA domain-containing protein [Acetobacter garciniae]MBO1323940.1 VWA domain-containing protein [Acetobacter garciniae]MBX0343629.1 VWA domain-containing protein [Acetobacter garciniae]
MIERLIHHVGFEPLIPRWLLAGLGLAALALCGLGLLRGSRIAALCRLGAAAVILFWLAGPQRLRETWQLLPQTALLLVDQSPSMTLGQRSAIARQAADILAHTQVPGLTIRTVGVQDNGHDGTRLFEALDQAAADIPPASFAGAMMITDGQNADTPAAIPERLTPSDGANGHTTLPLHVLLAAKGEERDRRLRILQAPPYALAGQDATLRVQVDDAGPGTQPGTAAELTIRTSDGTLRTVPVRTGVAQSVTVPVSHPGQLLVSLAVSPLENEVSGLNNQSVLSMTGIRDRLRVLLISGTPNQGERVWRRLLKADPAVDLIHFTILRPPEKDDGTPLSDLALIAFPVRELFQDKIDQFDLIILDGFENRHILPRTYLENIAGFVRKGGGLLLTAGPEFIGPGSLQNTPVGDILPAHVAPEGSMMEQRFRPTLTDAGRRHPVTGSLPGAPAAGHAPDTALTVPGVWGPWYRALRPDSTHGEVLMNGPDGAPLLVLDHVDLGRVALLLSDQIWLWSRGEGGGGPQAELLRRVSHWLMKEPELEEEQLVASLTEGTLKVTRHSLTTSAENTVTVISPSGKSQVLTLRPTGPDATPQASMRATEDGIWQVTDGVRTAYCAPTQTNAAEFSQLRATASNLGDIAGQTGGGVFWLGESGAVHVPDIRLAPKAPLHGANWLGFGQGGAHTVTGKTAAPLLPAWLAMVVTLALVLAGWWLESRRRPTAR